MSISDATNAAKRAAKMKRKRADRKAATKAKRAEAKSRDARIEARYPKLISDPEEKRARLMAFRYGTPPPPRPPRPVEDQPWTWDSRIKKPEVEA